MMGIYFRIVIFLLWRSLMNNASGLDILRLPNWFHVCLYFIWKSPTYLGRALQGTYYRTVLYYYVLRRSYLHLEQQDQDNSA